jgi:hypothetical protein
MSETFEQLYGNKGIDTPYERKQITYLPELNYNKRDLNEILRPETKQAIERARTFTINQNLSEYDELIADIDQVLKDLEARNDKGLIGKLKEMLSQKQFKEIIAFEREQSGYSQTGDFEIYSLLYNMKDSMSVRRDFLDDRFRTQITNETDIEKIQEAEESAIGEWEQLEAKVLESYKTLTESDSDQDDSHSTSVQDLNYEVLDKLEKQKRNKELLHTSLADVSYIHRNRYFMFMEIVEKAKTLVYQSNSLIDKNLKDFVLSLQDMGGYSAPKAHLILNFRKVKEKHEGLKGRMMTIEDQKETFASEKQYLYQQMEVKTIEPLKSWMYQQQDNHSESLDMFSQYMVNSMTDSRKTYEKTVADMLNFYKSESDFYEQQIYFLKNKEEIRKFHSIFKDLEGVKQIQVDWVDEYLKANGYSV